MTTKLNRIILFVMTLILMSIGFGYFHVRFSIMSKAKAQSHKEVPNQASDKVQSATTTEKSKTTPHIGEDQQLTPSELPSPSSLDSSIKMVNSDYSYDPSGRRDPFKPFIQIKKEEPVKSNGSKVTSEEGGPLFSPVLAGPESIEGYTVDDLKLVGIIWEVHDPKAMLKAPSNKVFMVHKQSRIGKNNGYVAAIREGEIVVVEIASDGKTPSTRVISLQK